MVTALICSHQTAEREQGSSPLVWVRPKPSAIPPARIPPKNAPPTPEQLAKAAVAERPTVLGRPERVDLALHFTLSARGHEEADGGGDRGRAQRRDWQA